MNHLAVFTKILKGIILSAEKNCGKYQTHPEILKKFAISLFLFAGLLAYGFIQHNMPEVLPCVRTVHSAIYSEYNTIHKGAFQFDEVREHLHRYGAPAIVSIGENVTRVIGI